MSDQSNCWGQLTIRRPLSTEQVTAFRAFVADERRDGSPCPWDVTDNGCELRWNGITNARDHREWLQRLIDGFFKPRGVMLTGEIRLSGEADADESLIKVVYNKIYIRDVAPVW